MNTKHRLMIMRFLSMVCLITGLVGCGPGVTIPTVTETAVPPTVSMEEVAANQIIVAGTEATIDSAIDTYNNTLPDKNQWLVEQARVELGFLSLIGTDEVNPPPFGSEEITKIKVTHRLPPTGIPDVELRLYNNGKDISTLLDIINQLRDLGVNADPNLFTGKSASDRCGHPYPHSGGGSPYSGEGNPYADLGLEVPADEFERQWAFKAINAGSFPPDDPVTGDGVSIAIFDTFPISEFDEPLEGPQVYPLPNNVSITVVDSIREIYGFDKTFSSASEKDKVSDHGLFVASLIKHIAPGSQVTLYRTLDDYGCGVLFNLVFAMAKSMEKRLHGSSPLVLSFSGGFDYKPDFPLFVGENMLSDRLPVGIEALEIVIQEAYMRNVAIVAAAGNESAPEPNDASTTAQLMQFPAIYELVIGVAASTQDNGRSCFSNQGDVAAPGGNGGLFEGKPCAPRTGEWEKTCLEDFALDNAAECPYGLIGASTISPSGYGFWSGTSFSTPLVTGLVALALEKANGDRTLAYCMIKEGAGGKKPDPSIAAGIINVAGTLSIGPECGSFPQ
ncbi:MAG TPA: S8/S53 family peptidase [Anaerolineales bacterium]|nr:S8/S53 family peptidase [Anaerolineales bacterium]